MFLLTITLSENKTMTEVMKLLAEFDEELKEAGKLEENLEMLDNLYTEVYGNGDMEM